MLRTVLTTPMLIAVATVGGICFCKAASIAPHEREMGMAAVVFLIAAQIAILPLFLIRQPNAMQLTRCALLGLVLHLLSALVLAVITMLTLKPTLAFAIWTLIFYWTTLSGLAFVFVKAVQSTPTQVTPSSVTPSSAAPTMATPQANG